MAKTQAPLLSLRASGTIAKTLVYGAWKGRDYARSYAVPAQNRTPAQVRTRNVFRYGSAIWNYGPAMLREPWEQKEEIVRTAARNLFIGANIRLLRAAIDVSSWQASPGVRSAPGLTLLVLNPSPTSVTVIMNPRTPPDGWTFVAMHAAAVPNQDPQDEPLNFVRFGSQVLIGSNIFVGDLVTATEYAIAGWIEFARPDGKQAFSPSMTGLVTTL